MPIRRTKLVLLLGILCLEQGQFVTHSRHKASTCGRSLVKPHPWNYFNIFSRIVGGSQVERGSYPWQVSLKRKQKHFCGGTIISAEWVITAAHCVANRKIASSLYVTAGEHDLSQTEPGEQNLTIKTIIKHPYFTIKKPMDYDIALLRMTGTFRFGQFVGPMCLPEPGERFEAGFICTTAGWGRLSENGLLPQVLQEVNLPILTQKECSAALLTLKKPISEGTFLCTGFPEGGRDACQGDSGGALMCPNKKGTWTLAGVTSWGLGCGRGWRNNMDRNDQGSPGIFTDLSKVLPWIQKHIQTGKRSKSSRALCGMQDGVVSGPEGKLSFPESPHLYYESSQLCVWTLLVPKEMHVLLHFSHLDAESCQHNYLSIYSLGDRLIGKFCGEDLFSSVRIGSDSIRLKFISDSTDYATGFNLTYKALKPNYLPDSGCGSLVVLFEEGHIQSLHYPGNYNNRANCNWIFQAPKHHQIKIDASTDCHLVDGLILQPGVGSGSVPSLNGVLKTVLSFQSLETEENGDCTCDYVAVHGDVERKEEIARLCGFALPAPVLSSSGVMFISFQSNENMTFSGFQAIVSFIFEADSNISTPKDEPILLESPWNVLRGVTNVSDDLHEVTSLPPRCLSSWLVESKEVSGGSWPWQVSLQAADKHLCEGALIGKTWVVTAAHCFSDRGQSAAAWVATAGVHDMGKGSAQKRFIKHVIIHPAFNITTLDYDLALMQLAEPLQFNQHIRPVCLPERGQVLPASSVCRVSGWRTQTTGGEASKRRQQLTIPILAPEACQEYYGSLSPEMVQRVLCAGFPGEEGKKSCWDDAGSPLVCFLEDSGHDVIFGITSQGMNCGQIHHPSLYTSIHAFMDWISLHLHDNGA